MLFPQPAQNSGSSSMQGTSEQTPQRKGQSLRKVLLSAQTSSVTSLHPLSGPSVLKASSASVHGGAGRQTLQRTGHSCLHKSSAHLLVSRLLQPDNAPSVLTLSCEKLQTSRLVAEAEERSKNAKAMTLQGESFLVA